MKALRQPMEVPAQRVGHRLRLVVVVEAGQVPPASVAPHLDEASPELDTEREPSVQEDHERRRCIRVAAEEDRQESGLEEERFPAEGVEGLSDVDDREVERPDHDPRQHRQRQRERLGNPEQQRSGDGRTAPGDDAEQPVRITPLEDAGRAQERHRGDEARHGQQSTLTEQRAELLDRHEEPDQVDRGKSPPDQEPADRIVGRQQPVSGHRSARISTMGGQAPPMLCRLTVTIF